MLINRSQSVFILGRQITDNTLLAQEIVRGYNRVSITPRCAAKINLMKAFDWVDWSFLSLLLRAYGFRNKICTWLLTCISTPYYFVSVNGTLAGYFSGARYVQQGDLLSPYLFVLVMIFLSHFLNQGAQRGLCGYHLRCKKLGLTHLRFADDLFVFM